MLHYIYLNNFCFWTRSASPGRSPGKGSVNHTTESRGMSPVWYNVPSSTPARMNDWWTALGGRILFPKKRFYYCGRMESGTYKQTEWAIVFQFSLPTVAALVYKFWLSENKKRHHVANGILLEGNGQILVRLVFPEKQRRSVPTLIERTFVLIRKSLTGGSRFAGSHCCYLWGVSSGW